jgi:hypothetical protein
MAITTFSINTNPTNGILTGFNASTGFCLYTPGPNFTGTDTFTYTIFCDGFPVDTATVTVNVLCVPVSGGTILGNTQATVGVNETFTISGITGLPPFTYNHVVNNGTIVSGQGTATFVVTPTATPLIINTTVSNCGGNNTVVLSKTLVTKVGCTPTVNVKFNCFTPVAITGTLQGVAEPNRVVSWTNTMIQFTAKIGLHNYEFIVTDTEGHSHTIVLKNILC